MPAAFIAGCAGTALTPDERRFFADAQPAGLILFQRNCETPGQVRGLTDSFRELCSGDVLILVDQEGGRVQRMAPPHWRVLPPARAYAQLYRDDPARAHHAARTVSRLCAHELRKAGVNMNCVPVLDVPAPDGHEIIGNRAYGRDIDTIVALAEAVAEGHIAGGVAPVVKHLPGHGRATTDSHLELPRVTASRAELEAVDFEPFRRLNRLPAGMTAHIVFDALDPEACTTTSSVVINDIIRSHIGFDGLLMSDDLSMKALAGDMGARTRRVLQAGCDLALHCNGKMEEMTAVARAAPALKDRARERFDSGFAVTANRESFDIAGAIATLDNLFNMTTA